MTDSVSTCAGDLLADQYQTKMKDYLDVLQKVYGGHKDALRPIVEGGRVVGGVRVVVSNSEELFEPDGSEVSVFGIGVSRCNTYGGLSVYTITLGGDVEEIAFFARDAWNWAKYTRAETNDTYEQVLVVNMPCDNEFD